MKKIFAIIIISISLILINSVSYAATVNAIKVKSLAPSLKWIDNLATGAFSYRVPAVVQAVGTAAGATASRAVVAHTVLGISTGGVGLIVEALALGGALYLNSQLDAAMKQKGYTVINNYYNKTVVRVVAPAGWPTNITYVGNFATQTEASNAAIAAALEQCSVQGYNWYQTYVSAGNINGTVGYWYSKAWGVAPIEAKYFGATSMTAPNTQSYPQPIIAGDVAADIASDINNPSSATFIQANQGFDQALQQVNDALQNPGHKFNNNPEMMTKIADVLEDSIPEETEDEVEEDIEDGSNTVNASTLGADEASDENVTVDEYEDAMDDALDNVGDDVPMPPEPEILMPDKLSLTTVMTEFKRALLNLPMVQTLRGLTIQCSGTSTLCLDLPSNLGGNRCFNAAGAQGGINMAGQALLSITALFMFVWIFRG